MDIAGIEQHCTLTKYVDTSKEQAKIEADTKSVTRLTTNGSAVARGNSSVNNNMQISQENQNPITEQSVAEKVSRALT